MPAEFVQPAEHREAISKRLAAVLREVPDHISLMPMRLEMNGTAVRLRDLFDWREPGLFVLAGEPGAGKSTLLATALEEALANADREAMFGYLPMAAYHDRRRLTRLLGLGVIDEESLESAFRLGGLVVLDAIDESIAGETGEVFEDVVDWAESHPRVRLIISCRSAAIPAWVDKTFTRIRLLPIDQKTVDAAMDAAGGNGLDGVLRPAQVRQMLGNPMMLTMALTIVRDPRMLRGGSRIDSKADLYAIFTRWIERREETRVRLNDRRSRALFHLRQAALRRIALRMVQDGVPGVDQATLQHWLAEFVVGSDVDAHVRDITAADLFDLLSESPPLRELEIGPHEPVKITFMHPSYAEFLAAEELRSQANNGDVLEVIRLLGGAHPKMFEVIYFVIGTAPEPEVELGALLAEATRRRDRDYLRCAAHALRYLTRASPELVGELTIRIIDAFKYWERPFDYELMYALAGVRDRVGADFPTRLVADLHRLTDKYARIVPRQIPHLTVNVLLDRLGTETHATELLDLFYTAGARPDLRRNDRERLARAIARRLETEADADIRIQGVAAIAGLSSPASLELLHMIVLDPAEETLCKVHALRGIGHIGSAASMELVISCLTDTSATYIRDSASWSLQLLGVQARQRGDTVAMQRVVQTYRWCLALPPAVEEEDNYTLGNVLYSIFRLDLYELREDVRRILSRSQHPYVIEDAIHTLGSLGGEGVADEIAPYLEHDDPIVRSKAAEALAKLKSYRHKDSIMVLLSDRYQFVAHTAAQACQALSRDPLATTLENARRVAGLYVLALSETDGERLRELGDRLFHERVVKHRVELIHNRSGVEARMTEETRRAIQRSLDL